MQMSMSSVRDAALTCVYKFAPRSAVLNGRANGAFTNEAEEDDEVWLESSSCPINFVQNRHKAKR